MNSLYRLALVAGVLLFTLSACQKPIFPDDDNNTNGKDKWEAIDYESENIIQHLYATPSELYAISESQFVRFDKDHRVVEKRSLDLAHGVRGIPAVSDHTFVRLTVDKQTRQIIEFHLARNPAQVIKIVADTLMGAADNHLEVEFLARTLGAFNSDGTLFLVPAKVFPARHYAFFMFEIKQNATHNAFTSVKLIRRVNIEALSSDYSNLINMRFLDGNFYITSREGAWRITPAGEVKKLFPQWMRDVFSWNSKLYITGFNSFDLHESKNSGLNWERLNKNSELKMVETAGGLIFNQEVLGRPYQLMPDDFLRAKDIAYAKNASSDLSAYYSVAFYANRYYFSIDRTIYFISEVPTR